MLEILLSSWMIFIKNVRYIAVLSLPFTFLGFVSYYISPPDEGGGLAQTLIGLLVYLIAFSCYISALIFTISQEYRKSLQPVARNILNGLVFAPAVMLTMVLANLPIIAAGVIVVASGALHPVVLLLIIVGVVVSLKATFAPFHVILEGFSPVQGVINSFRTTRGQIGRIVVILMLFYVSTSVVEVLSLQTTSLDAVDMVIFFLGVGATMLAAALQQIAVFQLYLGSFKRG